MDLVHGTNWMRTAIHDLYRDQTSTRSSRTQLHSLQETKKRLNMNASRAKDHMSGNTLQFDLFPVLSVPLLIDRRFQKRSRMQSSLPSFVSLTFWSLVGDFCYSRIIRISPIGLNADVRRNIVVKLQR